MTCIVGWKDEKTGRVWMGGDSAGIAGGHIQHRKDPKVFILNNAEDHFILGFTSSFRMGQLLLYKLEIPTIPSLMDPYDYMCLHFVDAVRKCMKNGGYAQKTNEEEKAGQFMVGVRQHLFLIDEDYQVAEFSDAFHSVGSGAYYAIGACHILQELDIPIEKKIELALQTAERYSTGVCGPFLIDRV